MYRDAHPHGVTVGAAETGSEPQATISVSTKRLSMTDQREVACPSTWL